MEENKSFYSPIYSTYNEKGFAPDLFFNALPNTLISLFIIISNSSLCYIIIKYRLKYQTIKSNTSTLLFIYASFEILNFTIRLIYFVRVSIGLNFLPMWLTKFYVIYINVSYMSIYFMYLLMSFDRLFAVSFPIIYKTLNKKLYIMGHLTTLIIFDISIFLIFIMPIFEYKNVLITGNPLDNIFFLSSINPIYSYITPIIFSITALIYLIIAILTKYKTGILKF
uniref:G-protein coupled receptors family 1 profile domain-containing protein n=1 Tax=Meloidogyne enterolobii TaxID=390850 RepID=A0A6V7VLH8_MELEN|nr:unnamed protein product [Meloidogyne enterolobii]